MAFMRGKGILGITLTIFLLTLIELSVEEIGGYFFFLMFSVVVALVVAIHVLFDSSVFFRLSLANFISVYTCVFIFFTLTSFQNVPDWASHVGYTLPLAAFVAEATLRRSDIQSIVTANRVREERHFGRELRWLVPVVVFAILIFVARRWFEGSEAETVLLLARSTTHQRFRTHSKNWI